MQTKPLLDTAPDFDQPIAVLKHCHDRIRKQLATLEKLPGHLQTFGANLDAKQGASSILRYFNQAAPNHHADEEEDLLPVLQIVARDSDATVLEELVPELLLEHVRMDAAWEKLGQQLEQLVSGEADSLDQALCTDFIGAYRSHMEREEAMIAPMALRLLSAVQLQDLGNAMRERRGIAGTENLGN